MEPAKDDEFGLNWWWGMMDMCADKQMKNDICYRIGKSLEYFATFWDLPSNCIIPLVQEWGVLMIH